MQHSPHDVTLDAPALDPQLSLGPGSGSKPKVRLVEGSGPQLSCETRNIRRGRLRVASFVLFLGVGLFLIWRIVEALLLDSPRVAVSAALTSGAWLAHVAVTALLGFSATNFCRRCDLSEREMLAKEVLVFGSPIAFLVVMQLTLLPAAVREYGVLPTISPPWLIIAFVYALFIPNCWRRASLAIGGYCLTPVLLLGWLAAADPVVRQSLLARPGAAVELTLVMTIAAAAALIGVHTINHLRQEAFRAKQMGQYRLRHLLGAGGMGEVYLAEHQLMKRPCAIKLIRPEKAGDPTMLARFEREVKATARLSHWNSIEIYDYGRTQDGAFYYVMEYLPGLSLGEIVSRHGPLPPERVIHFLAQTCAALGEAHELGLIHRDIKPANIFAARRGGVYDVTKLLDFGLAKPSSANDSDSEITQVGTITGSPLFMAPEQAEGDGQTDNRADLYSLGVVGYYLLTGRTPFEGEKPIHILIAHLRDQPTPPNTLRGDVPVDLEQVIMRCLEKSPADRYQSAAEMAAALEACEAAGQWTDSDARQWWTENALPASAEEQPMLV